MDLDNAYAQGFKMQISKCDRMGKRSQEVQQFVTQKNSSYVRGFVDNYRLDVQTKLRCGRTSHQCGNSCVPKTKKCRNSKRRSPNDLIQSVNIDAIVETEEDKIRNLPYERAVIIDPKTGRVLAHTGRRGSVNSVYFTDEELDLMKGAIVTHNHPSRHGLDGWDGDESDPRLKGNSFSIEDIYLASEIEFAEVRAAGEGWNHSLKPPLSGWNNDYFRAKIKPTYQYYQEQVYTEFYNKISYGRMDHKQASADFWHEVIRRTSNELGMQYSRNPAKVKR